MEEALTTNRMLAVRISQEREGLAYMTGSPGYQLRLNDYDKKLIVTAPAQLEVLSALDAYARALVQAGDQGVGTQLVDAANKLGAAAGQLAGAAVPGAAPISGPAIKLAGNLAGLALQDAYATKIQGIIRKADPAVQFIAKNMPDSLNSVALLVHAQVEDYEVDRLLVLDALRRDGRVNRLQRYKEYLAARADVDSTVTLQETLENSGNIFSKLAAAHKALAEGSPDASARVQAFAAVATDLAALVKALKTTQGG
ncbi:hypothetical protein NKJ26_21205 [Mesorhizobium sp. M0152]|uniref:hypothetical protein n=1 Tax=Mesorhizobium sp. M0152 TaxID=2956898 RepID=UPI003336B09E